MDGFLHMHIVREEDVRVSLSSAYKAYADDA